MQKNIQELGIKDKIESIKFSLPSMNKRTYKKLVRNGNLSKVLENLQYISFLKKSGKINDFRLNFVVCSLNYKEILDYLDKAKKLDAVVDIMMLSKNDESTEFLKKFDLYNVLSPKHPDYNSFIKIINSKKIKEFNNLNINQEFYKLEKVKQSFAVKLKNFFNKFFLYF